VLAWPIPKPRFEPFDRHTDQSIERFSGPVEQQTREQASGDEAIAACDALF
jgi:hypothetical protein